MARRLRKLIKRFDFTEPERARITLSSSEIRLNPDLHLIQLTADASGLFPLTADLHVKTWLTNPNTVKQWLSFEVVVAHAFDEDGVQLTFDGFKLNDGTTDLYWDGGAWSAAGASDWSTEADIATNIATFPVVSQSIQVIVNLGTLDETVSPSLTTIKILYASDIEFQEDIIYRSLLKDLRENIRPITAHPVKLSVDSTTIDLINDFPVKTPYNIVDIDSVYDNDGDPNHLTDLFASYNPGTKVITLTGLVTAGTVVWIRIIYEPEVSVTTKRTYIEIAKVPALVLADINVIDFGEGQGGDTVVDKGTGSGTRVFAPAQYDIEFVLRCLTDKARDQQRLADSVKEYFDQNQLIRSRGMDETYRLWLTDEFDQVGEIGQEETETSQIRFRIVKALFYNRGDEQVFAVERFTVNGPPDLVVS